MPAQSLVIVSGDEIHVTYTQAHSQMPNCNMLLRAFSTSTAWVTCDGQNAKCGNFSSEMERLLNTCLCIK